VGALTVFDDGGGEALYAGGEFTTAGGVGATSFARWDGSSWSALTSGTNNSVRAVTVFDDGGGPALYAGGGFITAGDVGANRIGKWDGSSWSALGSGTNDEVFCLTVFEDGSGPDLYAGGKFTAAGEVGASRIARWDGASWSALGSGTDDEVFAISVFNDGAGQALYAGGGFLTAGAVDASYIARWDGENWSPLGAGTDGPVYALAVFDDRSGPALYAGGSFNTAAGVEANNVARWNGSNWSALGSGMGGSVYALAVFDDGGGTALYAGGWFTTAGGAAAKRIAKWDGSNWSALGAGVFNLVSAHVRALTVFDDGDGPALYAGGNFGLAGGVGASNIAKWDGSSWSALGSGMGGVSPLVYALTVFDDGGGEALYAGGRFTIAGGNVSGYIAQWSCDRKSPMCSVAADCGDADDDGVRDEPCSWYSCSAGECDSVSRGFGNGGQFGQADVGSPAGPGVCNVDGVADGNDRFHAMNCFANANFGAPEPYPCEPNSPLTLNVDAGSPASCVLDGVCDGNDVFHTLNSFANTNFEGSGGYPCTCSGSAPRPPALRVEPLEHTGLTLRAPRRAAPGELVHVDVHLTSGLAALRGYQLHLGPGGGGNTAELQLTDISIDSARNDYAFAGVAGVWTAFNRSTAQMLAGMDALEGVPVSPGAYLATFTYRVPEDAAGIFVVEGRSGDHSAATQDRTFLFGAYARPIGVEAGPSTRVTVEEGNRRSRKPE
jgi:hypothetical protein